MGKRLSNTTLMEHINAATEYKAYTVTMKFRHPAWDEKDGIKFETTGKNKADAIRSARFEAREAGHLCGLSATDYSFSAIETVAAPEEDVCGWCAADLGCTIHRTSI